VAENKEKIIILKCDICGKEIKSLYQKQAEANLRIHKLIHG